MNMVTATCSPRYTSAKARATARSATKRGSYMDKGNPTVKTAPCKRKHRQTNKSVRVFCAVGDGKIRAWHVYEENWCAATYVHIVRHVLSKAAKKENGTKYTCIFKRVHISNIMYCTATIFNNYTE
jgi:hypothetical protein